MRRAHVAWLWLVLLWTLPSGAQAQWEAQTTVRRDSPVPQHQQERWCQLSPSLVWPLCEPTFVELFELPEASEVATLGLYLARLRPRLDRAQISERLEETIPDEAGVLMRLGPERIDEAGAPYKRPHRWNNRCRTGTGLLGILFPDRRVYMREIILIFSKLDFIFRAPGSPPQNTETYALGFQAPISRNVLNHELTREYKITVLIYIYERKTCEAELEFLSRRALPDSLKLTVREQLYLAGINPAWLNKYL